MISGGAITKIYRFAESPDFPINPVKTQNKSCQTYKVEKEEQINPENHKINLVKIMPS